MSGMQSVRFRRYPAFPRKDDGMSARLLQCVSNVTCDFIKVNKGIETDEVIQFIQKVVPPLRDLVDGENGDAKTEIEMPKNGKKAIRIWMEP